MGMAIEIARFLDMRQGPLRLRTMVPLRDYENVGLYTLWTHSLDVDLHRFSLFEGPFFSWTERQLTESPNHNFVSGRSENQRRSEGQASDAA